MNYQLLRGDCVHRLKQLPTESIDSFVSDPPYGIDLRLKAHRRRPASIAGDGRLEARILWNEFLPQAQRIARPDSAHLFFGTWKSIWMRDLLEKYFKVKGCIVWDKKCIGLGYYLRPRWELIWYVHKGKPPVPDHAPADIWQICRELKPLHPCQKPVDLLRKAIRLVCHPGGTVCDPFAGIGSTGVAAVLEGVNFIGIELSPKYVDLGRNRISAAIKEIDG